MFRRSLLAGVVLGCACIAFSQASAAPSVSSEELRQVLTRNFGEHYELAKFAPQYLTGDFNGDGIEDIAIVVTADHLPHAAEFGSLPYTVIDPYDAYFGYGDPKVTSTFGSSDPRRQLEVAIVHSWRAPQPKARYLVINLPFSKLETVQVHGKRKTHVTAIAAEETDVMSSTLVWDGKKYRWAPDGVE